MSVPVVFIHFGHGEYLPYVFDQAKKWSDQVIMMGDMANNARTVPVEDFSVDIQEFTKTYEHLSTNGHSIELFCMTRWLALRNLMRAQKIETCLYLDSDVLLFSHPTEEWNKFSMFEFTLVHWTSGHTSFWTLAGIEQFCEFMLRLYRDKSGYDWDKVSSHYHIRRKHGLGGGVCDMTLLEYHGRQRGGHVGEMMQVHRDTWGTASTFDHIISASDQGYIMRDGHKVIRFEEGVPWATLLNNGFDMSVRLNTLHCQGSSKNLIPRLFKEASNV